MRLFDTSKDDRSRIHDALSERFAAADDPATEAAAREIIARVRADGDDALVEYARRFDSPGFHADRLEITPGEIAAARDAAPSDFLNALDTAATSIREFHQREAGQLQSWMQLSDDGRFLGQVLRPAQRVGIYVPGGHAAYPSSVLMAAIPASVAGVREIIICSPPGPDGDIPQLVAAAAQGWADRVFRVGGAQAVAAMAYGTETIPPVDIIVGPGNRYVNAAKRQVYGQCGIDMLAGPSEVCLITDSGANPRYVAADLLAQIEHGADNRGVVLTDSPSFAAKIVGAVDEILPTLHRQEILRQTTQQAVLVVCEDLIEAADLANLMAPEHLHLQVRDPMALLPLIRNAGAVLLGDATAAAFGDYVAGPSHTLPTAGCARFASPLSVATFMKRISILSFTQPAARRAAHAAGAIADGEGFDAHALSARIRMESK